jgi:hypothetical protein
MKPTLLHAKVLCALFAGLAFGCFGGDDSGGALGDLMQTAGQLAQEAQQQQQAQQPAVVDPDASLQAKLGGYIDCINDTSNVRSSHDRYLEWVDEKAGPTCKEPNIDYGMYEVSADAVQTCSGAAEKGKTLPPPLPALEAAAAEVASIYAELAPLNNKAETYYEQGDYKDDGCAFAKQSHPALISLFDRYFAAVAKLKVEVDKVKGDADLRQLALLENAEGRKYAWHVKRTMIFAKRLVDVYPDGGDPKTVKADRFLPPFGEFEPVYKELAAYSDANKAEIDGIMMGSSFVDAAKELYGTAKELRRDYEAKKKKLNLEKHNAFIEDYNDLVRAASNISWN